MNYLEKTWYQKHWYFNVLNWCLLPLSCVFWLISNLRKYLFRCGVLSSFKSDVPVIVVGNISVGGNGKTPFVIWLCDFLAQENKKVVVISRGYAGENQAYPHVVTPNSSTSQCGDEPVLIAKRTGCPVIIGAKRAQSIAHAIANFKPDVIISDDGLQHYQIQRDVEICIVDSQRQFGNGLLLPAGPLRETKKSLNSLDLIIENGGSAKFNYQLVISGFYQVNSDKKHNGKLPGGVAVCAIGNPARFESSLKQAGIEILASKHMRDHHKYTAQDFIAFNDKYIYMTEKDAVKCNSFSGNNWYYLKVDAIPNLETQTAIRQLLIDKEIIHGL